MNKSQILTGAPWHPEKMVRQEGDEKRHSHRCIYFSPCHDGKKTSFCEHYYEHCRGAAHCAKYKEKCVVSEVTSVSNEYAIKEYLPFEGVKYVSINDIYCPERFLSTPPKQEKLDSLVEFVKKNGTIDKPIVVSCGKSFYELNDKYLRYYVAKKMKLREIQIEMGPKEKLVLYDKLRSRGTLVWVRNPGEVGEVIGFSHNRVCIKLDSGQEKNYDIHQAIKAEALRIM